MDGTLVDTNLANFLAYEKAINSVIKTRKSVSFNKEIRFNRTVLRATFPKLSEALIGDIIKAKEVFYNEFIHLISPISRNIEILKECSKANKCYLVTNCREERAIKTLSQFRLLEYFSKLIFRQLSENNIKINKYELALKILDIDPNIVIAFENEDVEIDDAKKVGIHLFNIID